MTWLCLPAPAVHAAHRLHRRIRHFRRAHRHAWRIGSFTCIWIGAPAVTIGTGGYGALHAGRWIGSGLASWWGAPGLGTGGYGSAWAASPHAVVAVPEPGTAALLGAFILLLLAVRP